MKNQLIKTAALITSLFTFGCEEVLKDLIETAGEGQEAEETEGNSEGGIGGIGGPADGGAGEGGESTGGNSSQSSCVYYLYTADAYGDGWNGAELEIYQNNNLLGAVECPADEEFYEITAAAGSTLEFEFVSGEYDEEVFYALIDQNENILFQVEAPEDGNLQTISVNCDGGGEM